MRKLQELFVEITHKCFLDCKHCSSEASASCGTSIPINCLLNLIDEGIPLGLKRVSLSGGEPLLHEGCFTLIDYAKKHGIQVCLYSCGVYTQNGQHCAIPISVMNSIKQIGTDKVIFSIQGALAETHDYITGVPGSFDYVIESVKNAIDLGIPTEIHFVPTNTNYQEIIELVSLIDKLGVNKISLLRLVEQGRAIDNRSHLTLSANNGRIIVNIVNRLREEYPNINIRLGAPFNCVNIENPTPCTAAQNKLLISASGEVFPCEAFKHLKGQMMTIYDNSLEFIWKNDLWLNRIREMQLKEIEGCRNCELIDKCHGGCPGERVLFNGSINKGPEIWCLRTAI